MTYDTKKKEPAMTGEKWDGYCRATEDEDPCRQCGASLERGVCKAWKLGTPPEERNWLRIVLRNRDTGEIIA